MLSERNQTACFTGHRILTAEASARLPGRLDRLIGQLYEKGIRCFMTGGAIGFDMIAAERVIEAKKRLPEVKLLLALPCLDHDAKWKEADRERLARVRAGSDLIVYVSTSYGPSCMHTRNRYMVDRSSVCVSYYDGRRGGTEKTLAYAEGQGLDIIGVYGPKGQEEKKR